jgi:hypothetical protein
VPSPIFWFRAPGLVFGRIPGASGTIFMFSAVGLIFGGTRASGPVFTFCTPGLVLGGTECARSHSHVLRSQTRFRQFSFFAISNSFGAILRAPGPDFMFCAPVLDFDGTEGVWSRLHVLRSRAHFRRYQGRRVPFLCFALPDSFSTVPRASYLFFLFYAPELAFGGTEGVRSLFHVLRCWTQFGRY